MKFFLLIFVSRLTQSPTLNSQRLYLISDPTIKGVRIVPRVEWGAQPPTKDPEKLQKLPPPYVIISHTASTFCYTQAQCVLNVRVAQTFHIESKGWDDIAYNFLVGGDGNVYEGRGWGVVGAHTFNYNIMSIGISFIGTFNTVAPTKAQIHAATKLIEFGVENGHIRKDYKLLGHRQCVKTESPGEVLYNIIKTWEHWSPTPWWFENCPIIVDVIIVVTLKICDKRRVMMKIRCYRLLVRSGDLSVLESLSKDIFNFTNVIQELWNISLIVFTMKQWEPGTFQLCIFKVPF